MAIINSDKSMKHFLWHCWKAFDPWDSIIRKVYFFNFYFISVSFWRVSWFIAPDTELSGYLWESNKKLSAHRLNFHTGFMFKDESATSISVAMSTTTGN